MLLRAYVCAACGDKCLSTVPDEVAIADYERQTGKPFRREDVAEICDDCFKRFMRDHHR